MNNDNNNSSNSNQQSQETPECEKETRAILPDIVLYNHVYFQNQILKKTLVYKYNLHLNLTFVYVTHASRISSLHKNTASDLSSKHLSWIHK